MIRTICLLTGIVLMLVAISGCDEEERRQAEASRQLVEADAKARTETIAIQRQLQDAQAEVGKQRDQLEDDRREFADQRNRDPLVANSIATFGSILACLLPLVLCIYLAIGLRDDPQADGTLTEILVQEIVAEQPTFLPPPRPLAAIVRENCATDEESVAAHADSA